MKTQEHKPRGSNILLKVLIIFNLIELIGSFMVNGDWGYIVSANLIILITIYIFIKKEKKNENPQP